MCKEEKPKATFDDVLEDMRQWNYDFIFTESLRDIEPWSGYIRQATKKQAEANHKAMDRIKSNLRGDLSEEDCRKLIWDLDMAFSDSLYNSDVPYTLFGIALGMRMAGLEVDDIKARMKWLV